MKNLTWQELTGLALEEEASCTDGSLTMQHVQQKSTVSKHVFRHLTDSNLCIIDYFQDSKAMF